MKKVALITGATAGIGKETAKALAEKNVELILPVRSIPKGNNVKEWIEQANPAAVVNIFECDLASLSSVRSFARTVLESYSHIDVLINNAGIYCADYGETQDGFERQWQVNYQSQFVMTNMLIGLIKNSRQGRIINVASKSHFNCQINFSNPNLEGEYDGLQAYKQSKLANVIFTKALAKKLDKTTITVNTLHPGTFIKTGLIKSDVGLIYRILLFVSTPFRPTPKSGSETIVYLATSEDINTITGEYFEKKKITKVDPISENRNIQNKLWETSLNQTKV